MQWTDDAILLSVRKFGEDKALLRVFARTHGVFAGIVRGATSKTQRGNLQAGNAVSVTWQARLAEQMGTFKIEPVKPFAAFAMQDKLKLAALSSACALMETSLPERHPYPKLYKKFYGFLDVLSEATGEVFWQEAYIKLELEILAESGFGLDLTHCAATGSPENLVYVSPKSGRAVSEAAGEPYKEKLLKLPEFLSSPRLRGDTGGRQYCRPHLTSPASGGEIHDGLALTGYFLEHRLAEPHGKKLPAARRRLWDLLQAN
jgi:DNA repair protein RecO (recombination protein O)